MAGEDLIESFVLNFQMTESESGSVPVALPKRPRSPLNIGQLLPSSTVNFGFADSVTVCSSPDSGRFMIKTAKSTYTAIMTAIAKTILMAFFIAGMITYQPGIRNRASSFDRLTAGISDYEWGFEFEVC